MSIEPTIEEAITIIENTTGRMDAEALLQRSGFEVLGRSGVTALSKNGVVVKKSYESATHHEAYQSAGDSAKQYLCHVYGRHDDWLIQEAVKPEEYTGARQVPPHVFEDLIAGGIVFWDPHDGNWSVQDDGSIKIYDGYRVNVR